MGTEIERKFLIDLDNLPMKLTPYPIHIKQAYLNFEPEVRIRSVYTDTDQHFILTIKGNGDLERTETEIYISASAYTELIQKTKGKTIQKDRRIINLEDSHVAELDIYDNCLSSSLATIEVEFCNLNESLEFIPPDWFGKEVTYDPMYKNKNLARTEERWKVIVKRCWDEVIIKEVGCLLKLDADSIAHGINQVSDVSDIYAEVICERIIL